jgi:hypothetical protein
VGAGERGEAVGLQIPPSPPGMREWGGLAAFCSSLCGNRWSRSVAPGSANAGCSLGCSRDKFEQKLNIAYSKQIQTLFPVSRNLVRPPHLAAFFSHEYTYPQTMSCTHDACALKSMSVSALNLFNCPLQFVGQFVRQIR